MRLLSFEGRASRAEYWWRTFVSAVVFGVVAVLLLVLGGVGIPVLAAEMRLPEPVTEDVGAVICLLLVAGAAVLYVWSIVAITVRRLHDLGLPGRAAWRGGASFRASFSRGTVGENEYGADPLG